MTENENKTEQGEAQTTTVEQPSEGNIPVDTTPADGEGCEGVTVVIIARDEHHGELMALSVKKNLTGVDADIQVVTGENLKDTAIDTLLEHLPHVGTERIILMTDGMVILNPVVLGDIACPKAIKSGDSLEFNTLTPVLMHKSALQPLLCSLKEQDKPYADIVNAYFYGCMPDGYQPLVLRMWREENWLMLVTSKNPDINALRTWGDKQKFAYIGPESWVDSVIGFLKEKIGE